MSYTRTRQMTAALALVDLAAQDLPEVYAWNITAGAVDVQLATQFNDPKAFAGLEAWAAFLGGADGPLRIQRTPFGSPPDGTRIGIIGEHMGVDIRVWNVIEKSGRR